MDRGNLGLVFYSVILFYFVLLLLLLLFKNFFFEKASSSSPIKKALQPRRRRRLTPLSVMMMMMMKRGVFFFFFGLDLIYIQRFNCKSWLLRKQRFSRWAAATATLKKKALWVWSERNDVLGTRGLKIRNEGPCKFYGSCTHSVVFCFW